MVVALHDLQIAQQGCQIHGAADLADAAAHGVHGLAVDVGGCGAVTTGGGALAHDLVVVKDVAGVEDGAVDGCTGQLHIAAAGTGAADIGGGGAQQILEEGCLHLFGGHGGEVDLGRQLHALALGCGVQYGFGGLHIQFHTHGAVHYLAGLLVVPGGGGFGVQLSGQRSHIQRLAGAGLHAALRLGSVAQGDLGQLLAQGLLIQNAAVLMLGDKKTLAAQLVGGVHGGAVHLLCQLSDNAVQSIGVLVGGEGNVFAGARQTLEVCNSVLDKVAVAAHSVGALGHGVGLGCKAGVTHGVGAQTLALQRHLHGGGLQQSGDGLLQLDHGFLSGQTAQFHGANCRYAGENLVVGVNIEAEAACGSGQNSRQHQGDPSALAGAGLCFTGCWGFGFCLFLFGFCPALFRRSDALSTCHGSLLSPNSGGMISYSLGYCIMT